LGYNTLTDIFIVLNSVVMGVSLSGIPAVAFPVFLGLKLF